MSPLVDAVMKSTANILFFIVNNDVKYGGLAATSYSVNAMELIVSEYCLSGVLVFVPSCWFLQIRIE
jgi:hypothetical protein